MPILGDPRCSPFSFDNVKILITCILKCSRRTKAPFLTWFLNFEYSMSNAYRQNSSESISGLYSYCNKAFCAWDFNITDSLASMEKSVSVKRDFEVWLAFQEPSKKTCKHYPSTVYQSLRLIAKISLSLKKKRRLCSFVNKICLAKFKNFAGYQSNYRILKKLIWRLQDV